MSLARLQPSSRPSRGHSKRAMTHTPMKVVNSTAQQRFFDKLTEINKKDNLLVNVKPRGPACNSDHCPFVEKGVPAVFIYTMGGISAYHDVFDRPETLPLTEFDDLYRLLVAALKTI